MRCPFCKVDDDRVIDSRPSSDGFAIRRRRVCGACERRYTTFERIEESPLRVVKKDDRREPFDRRKILLGLMKACEKRPIPIATLDDITKRIEDRVMEEYENEVPVQYLGERVMEEAAMRSATVPGAPRIQLYKNNVDGKGASYGSHENYLMARSPTFPSIVAGLTPFFVTRQVVCGSGRVGIGVAGTGISGCGPVIGLSADITNRDSVRAALEQVVLAYGGIDTVVVTAGVFVPPDKSGHIAYDRWALT